jgi:hypothetical protein
VTLHKLPFDWRMMKAGWFKAAPTRIVLRTLAITLSKPIAAQALKRSKSSAPHKRSTPTIWRSLFADWHAMFVAAHSSSHRTWADSDEYAKYPSGCSDYDAGRSR